MLWSGLMGNYEPEPRSRSADSASYVWQKQVEMIEGKEGDWKA